MVTNKEPIVHPTTKHRFAKQSASEDVANEYSEVQKENRDLVETEEQFVQYLRKIEPL
jgi:hypothetical protein